MTHAYSEILAHRLETGQGMTAASVGRTLVHELMIVAGAAMPLAALLICWGVGAPLSAAVTAAIWSSVGMIVVIEVVAGVRAELAGRQPALQIAAASPGGAQVRRSYPAMPYW